MNAKQWAVFFVALFSFDYAAAIFFERGYTGVPKSYDNDGSGYYGWTGGCRCHKRLTSKLDRVLEGAKGSLGRYRRGLPMRDHSIEEYELKGGKIRGFENFERKSEYRCSLSTESVRVYFRIGFGRLLINYKVSLVQDLLGNFLGGVLSILGNILGRVTDLLFGIVCPDVDVTIVLIQRFGGSGGFEVEGLYLGGIENISFLDRRFERNERKLGPYFRPIIDHGCRGILRENLHPVFGKHCGRVTAEREDFYYESSSSRSSEYSYSNDDDDNDDGDDE